MKLKGYVILFLSLFIVTGAVYFIFFFNRGDSEVQSVIDEAAPEIITAEEYEAIKIYIPSEDGKSLEVNNRDIPKTASTRERAIMTFDVLKKKADGYIPKSVKVLNAFAGNNELVLNLNGDIMNIPHESEKEMIAVYSIVNTMTEIGNIRKVKILVNGEEKDNFGGELNMSGYFERDENLIGRGE